MADNHPKDEAYLSAVIQRVHGISSRDDRQLEAYLKHIEEANKYDHKLLGQQQELFFCHPLRFFGADIQYRVW
uniref:Threonine--tRNA ligase, mitochondrial n=1 Tax=Noccaea caerulescens TaxID=107243 RepID=A0A1J3HNL5_NOCCA